MPPLCGVDNWGHREVVKLEERVAIRKENFKLRRHCYARL